MRRWMLIFLAAMSAPALGVIAPRVSVEVGVVDESGTPIEGATVRGDFTGVISGEGSVERERTDARGQAVVSGRSFFPVRIAASKEGYYPSTIDVTTREVIDGQERYRDRQVTVVLKEKRNPIPLYARRYSGELPVAKQWVGFDLARADWVAPYGKGVRADLQFWYEGTVKSYLDINAELRMRFSNPDDGLYDASNTVTNFSALKVPHEAPESGYRNEEKKWKLVVGGTKPEAEYRGSKSRYYFLRLRSTRGADGRIIESNYAKIYRDIWFSPKELKKGVTHILFTYYFNPTPNDRNLEFDVDNNLFQDLEHDEQVWEP